MYFNYINLNYLRWWGGLAAPKPFYLEQVQCGSRISPLKYEPSSYFSSK
jgi:hypothetical protein